MWLCYFTKIKKKIEKNVSGANNKSYFVLDQSTGLSVRWSDIDACVK